MSKFILLHKANGAAPVVLNTNNITMVSKSPQLTGCSLVILNSLDVDSPRTSVNVTETPEQIFEMLKS